MEVTHISLLEDSSSVLKEALPASNKLSAFEVSAFTYAPTPRGSTLISLQ